MVDVILGLQWGDEGKGKIVDVFASRYDIVARFQGGPNAGHTIEFDNKKFILHTIPSGIFHPQTLNVIGNGVIIDPYIFFREVSELTDAGIDPVKNLYISNRAHLILPTHRMLDASSEAAKGNTKIGSTLKGIGPTYTDKTARCGIRVGDITQPDFEDRYLKLRDVHLEILHRNNFDIPGYLIDGLPFDEYEKLWMDALRRLEGFRIINSEELINDQLVKGKNILAEGAQGTMLDVDFGSYPYVTSSNTISAGVCSGLGVSPHRIGKIYGVFKAYCTRVGSGPFPTELDNEKGELLRTNGHEFGSTTGRPRRCGWLDIPALKYSIMLNGVDSLIMMKTDILDSLAQIEVCTEYETKRNEATLFPFDLSSGSFTLNFKTMKGWNVPIHASKSFEELPVELKDYITFIEQSTGVRIDLISVGPDRLQTVAR